MAAFVTTYGFLVVSMVMAGVLALSLYLPLMAGQLSLASPGFYALGGYIAAVISTRSVAGGGLYPTWRVLAEMALAGVASGVFAAIVGVPALRLRGIFLAFATIAFVEVLRVISLNLDVTGGAIGIFGVPQPFATQFEYLWLAAPLLVLAMWFVARLERIRVGRAFVAIREDELAADAMGVNPTRYKVLSFTLSAVIAGMAGALSAHFINTWNSRQGTFDLGVSLMAFVLIGGSRTFVGPVVGGLALTALPEVLRNLADVGGMPAWFAQFLRDGRLIIFGVLIALGTVFFPKGFITPALFRRRRSRAGQPMARLDTTPARATDNRDGFLVVDGITCRFGGLTAVNHVSFSVHQGEIFGLIGPNGAGKTTLFNVMTGLTARSAGRLIFRGDDISDLAPHRIAEKGIARTFQNIRLFGELTALDNVMIARHSRTRSGTLRGVFGAPSATAEERATRAHALALLDLVGLADRAHETARGFPYGDQRRLEIARALALEPDLLLLDEPAAGMNSGEKRALSDLIRAIRDSFSLTIVLIEHNVPLVMGLCDRIAVLDFGELIALGDPVKVQKDPAVIEAYLGDS
jgi:ABC-type branched-subunit amino acid transport system ATPase component/ABC-type branched-subunit amino acid transport system permease subunit